MYIKLNNGVPEKYTIGKLRKENPNVSFPKSISTETLNEYGVYAAVVSDQPAFTVGTQNCTLNETPTLQDGTWTYDWTVTEKTAEEITAINDETAKAVRNQRDQLLADTDWMGMSDVTMSTEWATYRQALRDVPSQAGFPNTITWPTEPGA